MISFSEGKTGLKKNERIEKYFGCFGTLEAMGKRRDTPPKVFEKKSVLERDREIDKVCKKFGELQQRVLVEQERARFENYPRKYLKIDSLLDQLRNTRDAFIEIFKGREMSE